MKTIDKYIPIFIFILLLTACNNDDEYTPGDPVAANCMQVYFQSNNTADYEIESGQEFAIRLTIGREKTTNTASVPISVISKDNVFDIPSVAQFGAGEAISEVVIKFPDAITGNSYSFQIELTGEEFIDPYSQLEGSARFFGSVTIINWELFAKDALFTFTSIYEPFRQDIWKQEGTNKYKIENYINSGVDILFTVDESNNAVTPLGGYNSSATAWYFYDNETDRNRIPCYPPGSETYIIYCYWYLGASYTYLNPTNKTGRFYHYNYNSDEVNGYNALSFSWD